MRMQKEEKIVVVLLFMALGSLAVASWAFGPEETEGITVQAKEDSQISLEGIVLEINPTKTGGHLIIKLDSTQMPVFVPRDAGVEDLLHRLRQGDKVRITGIPKDFHGQQEIEVAKPGDVNVLV
jgi:hypothetical protein